jgi:hypothetical protein
MINTFTNFIVNIVNLAIIRPMNRRNNPFAPGAGLQPPDLAGRDKLLDHAAIDMDRVLDGRPTKGMMLLGLRGVGKTVLLNRLHSTAEEKGFRTAKVEAPEGGLLPQLLAPELRQVLYSLDIKLGAGQKVRRAASVLRNFVSAFKVKVGDCVFRSMWAPDSIGCGHLILFDVGSVSVGMWAAFFVLP